MPDLRRSATYRIAFTYSAAFALAVLLVGALAYVAADAALRRQQAEALREETQQLIGDYRLEGIPEVIEEIHVRSGASGPGAFGYALFAGDRRIDGRLDASLPPLGPGTIVLHDHGGRPQQGRSLTTRIDATHTLVIASSDAAIERVDGTLLQILAGGFVLVVVIGAAGALVLGGYLRRRLSRIAAAAQSIGAGDVRQRVPLSPRDDEFDALAGSINAMLDRIERLLEKLRQVSSDIAHDLRTPLSRLRTGLETALDSGDPRAAVERAIGQVDDILSLFAGILRIAEVEGGRVASTFAPVDLTALLGDLGEGFEPAIRDRGRALRCQIAPDLWAEGDRELLAQAIVNLLDNAQAHTPSGSTIDLVGQRDGNRLLITVADDGPGVAAEDYQRIVQRFVRLDASRSTAGNGLGLNMVAAIVAAHGGTLTIGDNAPGLRVTLSLPRGSRPVSAA